MRKLFILLSVIIIQAVLLVVLIPKTFATPTPVHANCLQIKVKFNAPAAWMKSSSNRTIQIGCSGEIKPTGAQSCEGAVLNLKPGQEKTLGNCSCFNKQGCLVVGKTLSRTQNASRNKWIVAVTKPLSDTADIKSGKCSVTYVNRDTKNKVKLASICGTNKQKFNIGINIKCTSAPVTPTPTISITPPITPTITPTPPICVGPRPVTNVKVTCPTCLGPGQPSITPTPTPTDIPIDNGGSQ